MHFRRIQMNSRLSSLDSAGDWQQWDRFWKDGVGSENEILYTPGTPRTLLQLWQRCYFEDLWVMVGDRAKNCSFLELGCGRATTSMYLAAHDCNVTLLDKAPHALVLAEHNFAKCNLPRPRTVLADAAHTGLPDASFDCIYNVGLLEHFQDPTPVLREAWRLLRPGGVIFMVIVPHVPFTRSLAMRFRLEPCAALMFCVKNVAKYLLGRNRSSAGITRTDLPAGEYVRIMKSLGCRDAQCIPYNPYHPIDTCRDREIQKTVPFYWQHYLRTAAKGVRPALRTPRHRALCELLICRN